MDDLLLKTLTIRFKLNTDLLSGKTVCLVTCYDYSFFQELFGKTRTAVSYLWSLGKKEKCRNFSSSQSDVLFV